MSLFGKKHAKYAVSSEADFETRRIITPVEVSNPCTGLSASVNCLWDMGGKMSTITKELVDTLCLVPDPNMRMRVHTTSEPRTSNVYWVSFLFGNETVKLPVMECDYFIGGASVLIGMDVISKGDFILTSVNGKTEMKFRIPPQGHIGK